MFLLEQPFDSSGHVVEWRARLFAREDDWIVKSHNDHLQSNSCRDAHCATDLPVTRKAPRSILTPFCGVVPRYPDLSTVHVLRATELTRTLGAPV